MAQSAFLFAGQGSQSVGMGKDLYQAFPEARRIFDRADAALGMGLARLCFEGPAEALKPTVVSQPAIFTVSLAAYECFRARAASGQADFVAGLSLGEYSAIVAAGCLSFEEGLSLVQQRGRIMEEASLKRPGAMSAVIGLGLEKVQEACLASGAEIANINAPEQIVISGEAQAVGRAEGLCSGMGAKKVVRLQVSGGFHSSLMKEASFELKKALEAFRFAEPSVAVVSNVTACAHSSAAEVKENLVRQMYSPVKWVDSMRFLLSSGVVDFTEFGPGKVLKGLMRRIDAACTVRTTETKEEISGITAKGEAV